MSAPQQPAPLRDHDLDAVAGQQPDRGLVDLGRQHLLGAAAEQRDARAPRPFGREHLRPVDRRGRRQIAPAPGRPSRAAGPGSKRASGRPSQAPISARRNSERPRQHGRQQRAQQAIGQRPAVGLLDVAPRMVDEVHVVDVGGAGGHAGEARQAAVDVLDDLLARRLVVLEHVLDQVDAAARAVELVAEQQVGRAGRGAEAAMHAAPQDLLRRGDVRIAQLLGREDGLHRLPAARAPRVRSSPDRVLTSRSKVALTSARR